MKKLDPNSVLSKVGPKALDEYLRVCKEHVMFDVEAVRKKALADVKYYGADKKQRENLRRDQSLEQRWYDALIESDLGLGQPDYSVYDDASFLAEAWACWSTYSRHYLMLISEAFPYVLKSAKRIVDLGCGFGYTTAALKELAPQAEVFGTNRATSMQYSIGKEIGKKYGFEIQPDIIDIGKVDLVFASEYFEHWESPVQHLIDVLVVGQPTFMVVANSFGSRSVGHFNIYRHAGKAYENSAIGRVFNQVMRTSGMKQMETKFWNNRPQCWSLTDIPGGLF